MASTQCENGTSGNRTIELRNGQKKYRGPPLNWSGPPPAKGSEVFVGKIPRDLTEDDLLPVFERIGPVFEMRLMLELNGGNRGFAFVTFTSPADASKAIQQLNRYEIRPKRFIGVIRSLDNCRLFVGGIPKDKTQEDIRVEMSQITDGVVGVILYSSIADKSKNRGFAFVEYETHRAAAVARRKCMPGRLQLWGKTVAVDWAEPEPIVEEEILSRVRILYVRNLLVSTKEEELEEVFNAASDDGVEKVKILNDFAFVHFTSREQAQRAMDTLQGQELKGVKIQITWAKPATDKNKRSSDPQRMASNRKPTRLINQPNLNPLAASHIWARVNFSPIPRHLMNNHAHLQTFPSYPFYPPHYLMPNHMSIDMIHNQNGYPTTPAMFGFANNHIKAIPNGLNERHHPSWNSGGFCDKVEALVNFCRLHSVGEPIFETNKGVDERYSAKLSLPILGSSFGTIQTSETYETEGEAHQAIAGVAVSYLATYYTFGGSSLSSQFENLTLKIPSQFFPGSQPPPQG